MNGSMMTNKWYTDDQIRNAADIRVACAWAVFFLKNEYWNR